jgi:predicted NBD/HSP70 family sugar kinase
MKTPETEALETVVLEGVRGSNQSGMRAHNERLVLTLIRQMGPMAKAEIARLTGLSAQTVSVIMRALEADGLLKKGEPVRGKVGQPSVPMSLAAEGAYFLGLKVGRRSLDLILCNFLGEVMGRVHLTHRFPTPDNVVKFANESIAELLGKLAPAQRARLAGLGIAIPFHLWDWAKPLGVKLEDMADWRRRDVAAEIDKTWDFPVYLRNDASAACGAELVFGDQTRPRDFLYFFIGFFIGGGLVLDNTLYTGRTGNAAALGPLPVAVNGELKQLVEVASLSTLEKMLIETGGAAETVGDILWSDPETWTIPAEVLDKWLETASEGLALAIYSAACIVDVESVMLDGWMPAGVRADLVARTRKRLEKISVVGIELPDLRPGTIGHDARALGAASLPLSERFLVDKSSYLKA